MKTLIIGCSGQLGTECRSVRPDATGIDFPELDISNRFQCLEKLDQLRPDVIVNCAAYTAVDACETDSTCWKVNADGPKHLAEWAAGNGAFLVHVSTDYVFGGDRPLFEASVEADPTGPVSEYGRSKLAGEQAILESDAPAAVLRTAWLYGRTGKNFLKTMLRLALQDPDREVRVVNDQFGSPTWARTLARQITFVAERRLTGVFHATSEGYCSWYELARRFLERMDVPFRMAPCSTAEYPTPARRPANSILENAALKQAGVNLFDNWETELEQFVDASRTELLNETKELLK
jgi:dTDP-4-dehydrorhamnose reductase